MANKILTDTEHRAPYLFIKIFKLLEELNSNIRSILSHDIRFHFISRVIYANDDNGLEYGTTSYILGEDYENVVSKIKTLFKNNDNLRTWNKFAKTPIERNKNAELAQKTIENRDNEDDEKLHMSFLTILFNYPVSMKEKTVDVIAYDELQGYLKSKKATPYFLIAEVNDKEVRTIFYEKNGNLIEKQQPDPQPDPQPQDYKNDPIVAFYFDEILELIAGYYKDQSNYKSQDGKEKVMLIPIYDGSSRVFGNFIGWLSAVIPANLKLENYFPINNQKPELIAKLFAFDNTIESFKSFYYHLLVDDFLTQPFSGGTESCTDLIRRKIDLLGIWERAEATNNDLNKPDEYEINKNQRTLTLPWEKLIQYQENFLPARLHVGEVLDEVPEFLQLNFARDFILPANTEDEAFLINHYRQILLDIYFGLRKKKELMQKQHQVAVTAIMARNLSHNIGSHVLSTVKGDYIKDNTDQVSDFHAYLQKRMDLIARMVGGQYASGEPMFFVGDVLKGFFKQDLLLNHLVKDQGGYEKDKIIFKVCLLQSEPVIFRYKKNDSDKDKNKKWICDSGQTDDDFLVSIPDGEIGCQAFYLFLESMMRNSAKYGLNKDEEFFITIKVEDKDDYYKVSICDNLSLCNGNIAESIRTKLDEATVDSQGQLITKNFGIAEMREACSFLMGPFGEDHPAHENHGNKKKYSLWVECPGREKCHKNLEVKHCNCDKDQRCNHLTYTFNLMKPQMIAIVGKKDDIKDNKKYGIKKFAALTELTSQKCAYQFVLIYVNDENKEDIISNLQEFRHLWHLLPFRLMLVGDAKFPDGFPERRVITCPSEEICANNLGTDPGTERLIISTYETWIRNRWLKKKEPVNFVLAFDRDDNDTIFDKYKKIKDIELLSDKVNWSVYRAYVNNEKCNADRKHGCDDKNFFLIYDNHSRYAKAKKILNNSKTLFHHNTGEKNKKIFETLASPPNQKDFTFQYFLLGLLEAALTKVLIIDERVAESCIEEKKTIAIEHLLSLDRCLCHPLFYVRGTPLNKFVEQKQRSIAAFEKKRSCDLTSESSKLLDKNNYDKMRVKDPDFVIVHYGLIETMKGLENINDLYSLAPAVVITSGRGAGTIKKDETIKELPFMEASILKDNTYPSISKYHLVRALMSVKGCAE